MISYHFYATPSADESPAVQQFTFFDQADRFIATVRYIEAIRQRLSPATQTTVNEIGSILAGDPDLKTAIPDSYWNLSGACYAYVFGQLATLGIDIAGESQLVGYPTRFPSVSMVDWSTGAPNARLRVLELIKNNFHPGDRIVKTASRNSAVYALGMISPKGERKLLLVNKRDREIDLTLKGRATGMQYVDQTTKGGAPGQQAIDADKVTLRGLGVAVVTMAVE